MTNQTNTDPPLNLDAWPDFFPEDVPPEDAYAPQGNFYRITNKELPTKKCFSCDYEKDPNLLDMRSGLSLVCSYGVSLQNTIEGARITVGKFKNATHKRFIAHGQLNEKIGLIKQTFKEEYHHTLWIFKDVEAHKYFRCVEVVDAKK